MMLVAKVNELNRSIALDFQIVSITVQKHIQHLYRVYLHNLRGSTE